MCHVRNDGKFHRKKIPSGSFQSFSRKQNSNIFVSCFKRIFQNSYPYIILLTKIVLYLHSFNLSHWCFTKLFNFGSASKWRKFLYTDAISNNQKKSFFFTEKLTKSMKITDKVCTHYTLTPIFLENWKSKFQTWKRTHSFNFQLKVFVVSRGSGEDVELHSFEQIVSI